MTDVAAKSSMAAVTAAMPGVFVLLWSTGFIGAKLGLPYAEPMTFLALRFAIVSLVLAAVALVLRSAWPRSLAEVGHMLVAGFLLHGVYLGGVFASINLGVETGVSALIVGMQPLLVALAAGPLLGERFGFWQWTGFVLGVAGVALVVARKLTLGIGTPTGMWLSVLALAGLAAGTLYQKKYCGTMNLVSGNALQFAAAAAATGVAALLFENLRIEWTGTFLFALVWLVVVLSFGAITLLYIMIRNGAAAKVSSLFFLVPPATAIIGWILFDERFGVGAMIGMLLAATGVAMVNFAGGEARR